MLSCLRLQTLETRESKQLQNTDAVVKCVTVVLAGSILFVEESCRLSSSLGNHKLGQWKRKVNELPLMYHVNKLLAC